DAPGTFEMERDVGRQHPNVGPDDLLEQPRQILELARRLRRTREGGELRHDLSQMADLAQYRLRARAERSAKIDAGVAVDALQVLRRELNRCQGVLDLVSHLARHLRPGRQAITALELPPLPVEVAGHLVEGFDEGEELVSARRGDARIEVPPRDTLRGAREIAQRPRDAARHGVGEEG